MSSAFHTQRSSDLSRDSTRQSNNSPGADFRLLDKFQTQWEQIHIKSEQNVIKARVASKKLASVERKAARHLEALDEFIRSCKCFNMLEENISNIENDLKTLESSFAQIEDLLTILRNHKEHNITVQYVDTLTANSRLQISERKNISKSRRDKLKSEHLERVEVFEREQQKELEERRKVLERAFEEEKNRYLENQTKET